MTNNLSARRKRLLPCPHCGTEIEVQGRDWFACSRCKEPVRKQTKDRVTFLEAGARIEIVRPIEFKDTDNKPPIFINTMPLNEVMEYKNFIEQELARIKTDKEKVADRINFRSSRNQNTGDLLDQLNRLDNEADELNEELKQLISMEKILRAEREDAIRKSDSSRTVFGCSFFVLFFDLLIFAWIASIAWNWKAILSAIVIIFVTAIILSTVAAPKKDSANE